MATISMKNRQRIRQGQTYLHLFSALGPMFFFFLLLFTEEKILFTPVLGFILWLPSFIEIPLDNQLDLIDRRSLEWRFYLITQIGFWGLAVYHAAVVLIFFARPWVEMP